LCYLTTAGAACVGRHFQGSLWACPPHIAP